MQNRWPSLDPGVYGLIAVKLALHAVSLLFFDHGLMGDEAYFLACAERLDFGYVDHPALSILILRIITEIFGSSTLVLRVLPVLCGATVMALASDMARTLGGGPHAQRLTALAILGSPVVLALNGFYSMNALDLMFWAAATNLVLRCSSGESRWSALGVVLALGLANKLSVIWLGCGLFVGLLLDHRALFATRGPWIAAGLAMFGLLPYLGWNAAHDWATLEWISNASANKLDPVTPTKFFTGQLLVVGPHLAPLWLVGLASLLWRGRPYRIGAVIWLTVVALLVARSHVRAYYLAAAYPVLFAAGAVALEQRLGPRWTIGWTGVTALVSAVLAPLSLPLMSIPSFFVYEARLGLAAPTEQAEARATKLPLHFATKLANPPVAAAVAEAWATLTPAEQADAVILTQSYTEAGAVDRLGPALGLPPSISFHVNHWIWGPGEARSIAIVTADADDSILERFRHVERAATIDCPLCMGSVHDAVYVCRDPLRPIPEIWPELKRYR